MKRNKTHNQEIIPEDKKIKMAKENMRKL